MKNSNASAAAHSNAAPQKNTLGKKDIKAKASQKPSAIKVKDTNALSKTELALIKKIDAKLKELYYLNDENEFLGFC